MADAVTADEVTDVLRENLGYYEDQRTTWRQYRSAYRTCFHDDNPYRGALTKPTGGGADGDDDGLPFKIEANKVWPFVQALVANLFYRQPRTQVELPLVWDAEPGRPQNVEDLPDIVTGYLDEFLKRSGIRPQSTAAYGLAIMYGASAFKQGITKPKEKGTRGKRGSILTRSWARAIPHWELVLDRNTQDLEQQAYVGHVRWELAQVAEDIVKAPLPDEAKDRSVLTDYLEDGYNRVTDQDRKFKRYVRLLEFYDLIAEEQRFYIVDGQDARTMRAYPFGEVLPITERPDGSPALPITPVILASVPDLPLQGVSAVSRIYQLNAEQNTLLTIIANAMRRDAGRAIFIDERIDDTGLSQLTSGRDMEIIKVKQGGSKDTLAVPLEIPQIAPSLDKHMAWLTQAWSDTQGAADLMQGKQGDYLSATEASLLAGFGEATSGDIQQRMSDAIGAACELQLVLTAAEMGKKSVSVRRGKKFVLLTKDIASMPWTVGIVDSAATPVKDMRKKEAFLQVLPNLMQLVAIAEGGKQPDPANPGQMIDTAPPATRRFAQEALNYMQQLWALPESMSWDALAAWAESEDEKKKAEAEGHAKDLIASLPARIASQAGQGGPPPMEG